MRAYRNQVRVLNARDGPPEGSAHEWLLEQIRRWRDIHGGREMQFIPHMERWLRNGQYDFDEQAERAASPKAQEQDEDRARRERVAALRRKRK